MIYFAHQSKIAAALIGILSVLFGLRCEAAPVLVAAASSTQFVLQDIKQSFERDTGLQVVFSFSSSGNLTRQILQGGPYQVFISADPSYVDHLDEQGLTLDSGVQFATGRLVLYIPNQTPIIPEPGLTGIKAVLNNPFLKRLAIANPQHAPYGMAANQVLQHLDLLAALQAKLVYGENVAQAAQFCTSGAVQGGLIAYSLTLTPKLKQFGQYVLIPEQLHQPLETKMVLLKSANRSAQKFFQYLQEEKAKLILERFGYTVN